MKKLLILAIGFIISLTANAGGNPEHVAFPANYKSEFTSYDTRNRTNGKQLAVMYANQIAIDSAKSGTLADGSKIVMEVHKIKKDEEGNPVTDENGLFQRTKHAAVAVMEKRSDWDASFPEQDRIGGWGFAIYKADGTEKENNLECAVCHTPYEKTDYMFSYSKLIEFVQ